MIIVWVGVTAYIYPIGIFCLLKDLTKQKYLILPFFSIDQASGVRTKHFFYISSDNKQIFTWLRLSLGNSSLEWKRMVQFKSGLWICQLIMIWHVKTKSLLFVMPIIFIKFDYSNN